MKIPEHLTRSGMIFGMTVNEQFKGEPLQAGELFPAICDLTGEAIPPRYYAEMILECRLMELRGRELWAEPSWCEEMMLHCADVGEEIASAFYEVTTP